MSIPFLTGLINRAIEELTGFMGIISSDHAYIHKGIGFSLVNTATINDGVTLKFHFKTPDADALTVGYQKYIHWRPAGISTASAGLKYSLYEASTGISGGSVVTPINRNRTSKKTSKMQTFVQGATVTAGILIQTGTFGTAGNPAKAAGGASGSSDELILKPNTDYSIELVNLGGANSVVTWDFFWYEEDKKESNGNG